MMYELLGRSNRGFVTISKGGTVFLTVARCSIKNLARLVSWREVWRVERASSRKLADFMRTKRQINRMTPLPTLSSRERIVRECGPCGWSQCE
eukprot:scaffold224384_cov35-Tisochrysis_lutea.AAC.4